MPEEVLQRRAVRNSLNGTASWPPVVLGRVMDRCDRDRRRDRRLALFRPTEQGSLGIGNRRLGHHCLARWPYHPALACRPINMECDATQATSCVGPSSEHSIASSMSWFGLFATAH